MREVLVMKGAIRTVRCLALALIISLGLPLRSDAKGYSSGSHSYSSSSHSSSFGSSHSFSSGSHSFSSSSWGGSSTHNLNFGSSSSRSFNSGSGKSYSSGSLWNDQSRHSYSSGKSYSSSWSQFSFDTAAARARKEMASKQDFTRFKDAQRPPPIPVTDTPRAASDTYRVRSAPSSSWGYYHTPIYVPTPDVFSTRRVRIYNVFNPYYTRPVVIYHDPYSSFFWWWLLDRSLDDRAWWAYSHRYDMDPARYQALLAADQQLELRLAQLEAQQPARDPNFTPTGLDRDLMYSDQYVTRAYQNRPTTLGLIAFWFLGIPTALSMSGLVIWLIWFKRWQTAT
jgi:hypothetical protein